MLYRILLLMVGILLTVLYSCSDAPTSKEQIKTGQTYSATLAEGIDFTRPDYPAFIAETQGISIHESWGRWTDGDRAVIRFRDNLPRTFVLELLVEGAFGPNAGAPIKVRVGTKVMIFLIMQHKETFRFDFATDQDVNTVEILIPYPATPKSLKINNDERLLGIGLIRLRILPK
jgi:phosphoglycerol transferase